ncbi:MAG: hypothetical protein ACOC6P_01905, partial [Candidatus Aminicenantaceae bacterium]
MREKIFYLVFFVLIACTFLLAHGVQESIDFNKVTGDWDMEIDAQGEYFYLSFFIEKIGDGLRGTISDDGSGMFTDVELADLEYNGQYLTFVFTVPTPPDGMERPVRAELEVSSDEMAGYLF